MDSMVAFSISLHSWCESAYALSLPKQTIHALNQTMRGQVVCVMIHLMRYMISLPCPEYKEDIQVAFVSLNQVVLVLSIKTNSPVRSVAENVTHQGRV